MKRTFREGFGLQLEGLLELASLAHRENGARPFGPARRAARPTSVRGGAHGARVAEAHRPAPQAVRQLAERAAAAAGHPAAKARAHAEPEARPAHLHADPYARLHADAERAVQFAAVREHELFVRVGAGEYGHRELHTGG